MSQSDFVTRGQALVAAGQYQEAVKVCRLGLLGRPTTVEGRVVLGSALLALKRFDEVLAEMRVALELDHQSISAGVLKAEALLKKGDSDAAIEVLQKMRKAGPPDARVDQLYAEANRAPGHGLTSAVHPSVGFVSAGDTKHYPQHDQGAFADDEGSEDNYTRPTSLASPSSVRRSDVQGIVPSPHVLAVGDRSGTMEVDPDIDGVDLEEAGAEDFGDLAAPPRSHGPQTIEGARGSIQRSRNPRSPAYAGAKNPGAKSGSKKPNPEISTVELDDDEMIEVETGESLALPRRTPGPRSIVREAVQMPAGVLGDPSPPRSNERAKRPTERAQVPAQPSQLAQMIAAQPHIMQIDAVGRPPQSQRIAAALPTAAAQPMPMGPTGMPMGVGMMGPTPGSLGPMGGQPQQPMSPMMAQPAVLNASARTVSLSAAQQQSANAVDALFSEQPHSAAPSWAQSTVVAGGVAHLQQQQPAPNAANEPTAQPAALDPHIQALMYASDTPMLSSGTEPSNSQARPLKTGVRRTRSRLQVALWVFIGVLVIGGGVFAGFQIRSMRLRKEIDAERLKAVEAAKGDTFAGWIQARNSLAGIVHASATPENRAALTRARALLAYQFLDGVADAKTSIENLKDTSTFDGALASAYLALAQGDPKVARTAAEAAQKLGASDPAAAYVMGQAQLLNGDFKGGLASLKTAAEAEPRPQYQIAYAHAAGRSAQWDDAFAAIDKVLAATPDHPGALIERTFLLADSGRLTANASLASELKGKLEKLVVEAGKPIAEQTRGVSSGQAAYANLALALADFALGKDTATADVNNGLNYKLEDQRFAETAVETVFAIGRVEPAIGAAMYVLKVWPSSIRGRLALAALLLADGKPIDTLDTLGKSADVMNLPKALPVRGMARLANGELDLANTDFDAALKKTPNLELALIGRAQVLLARGDVDGARKVIEPRYNVNTASISLATTYAQILRSTGEPEARAKAQALLEKAIGKLTGAEIGRAQLELARNYRAAGDSTKERAAFEAAERNGNRDAPIEAASALIDDGSDPSGGREALNQIYTKAGDHPNPRLVLETARARMLMGDHAGAKQLLDVADKLPNVSHWMLERERARLALRRGDVAGAADAVLRALDDCGQDEETFELAGDVAYADASAVTPARPALATKLKALSGERLKGSAEASIVEGKLALAIRDIAVAESAFAKALEALEKAKASSRRRAQANFGLAVIDYLAHDDPSARDKLDLVIALDPSIYSAYAFYADIAKEPKKGLEKARKAVDFDPEFVDGWAQLGALAAKANDKKLLNEAVGKLNELAPDSEALKELAPLARK